MLSSRNKLTIYY